MADMIAIGYENKIREDIGRLAEEVMIRLNRSRAFWLDLGWCFFCNERLHKNSGASSVMGNESTYK